MSLISSTQLSTLDYTHRGLPFVEMDASGALNLLSMDVSYQGLPFVAPAGTVTPVLVSPPGAVPGDVGWFLGRTIRAGNKGFKVPHFP